MMISEETITISRKEYEKLLVQNSRVSILEHQLSELRRMIFGANSEQFITTDADQMTLFDLPEQQAKSQEKEQITYTRNKSDKNKKQPLRIELTAHLPRKEEIIEPESLPEGAKKIGEAVTEILEYEPFTDLCP